MVWTNQPFLTSAHSSWLVSKTRPSQLLDISKVTPVTKNINREIVKREKVETTQVSNKGDWLNK